MNVAFNWSIWFICKGPYNGFLFPKIRPEPRSFSADSSGLCLFSFWESVCAYTTLCKPSVFSISSITPSVATIIMVASAAMVGSK